MRRFAIQYPQMYWSYQNEGDMKPKVDGVHLPPRGKSKSFEYNGQFIRKSIYFQQTRNKWVVQWQFANGHRRTQTFNCNTLGRDEALRLAEAITPESIPPEPSPRDNPYLVARKRNREGVPGIYDQAGMMGANMMRSPFPGVGFPSSDLLQQQLLMNPWAANFQMFGMDPAAMAAAVAGSAEANAAAAAAAAGVPMDANALAAAAAAAAGSNDDPAAAAAALMSFPFFPAMFGSLPGGHAGNHPSPDLFALMAGISGPTDPAALSALSSMFVPDMFNNPALTGALNVAGSDPATAAAVAAANTAGLDTNGDDLAKRSRYGGEVGTVPADGDAASLTAAVGGGVENVDGSTSNGTSNNNNGLAAAAATAVDSEGAADVPTA